MVAFDPPDIPGEEFGLESRLPVKARKLIADLRRAAHAWKAHAEETRLATRPAETDTVLDQYALIPIGLPRGERVTFKLGPLTEQDRDRDNWITVRARTDVSPHYVEVTGPGLQRSLIIEPQSGNVVRIRLDHRGRSS